MSADTERDRLASWSAGRAALYPDTLGSKYDGIDDYRRLMDDKLRFGDEKYGHDSWGRHDMLAEAMAEMVDLGNYAYLKWRQLRALQERLDADGQPRSLTGEDRLGVQPGVGG
jgi:hypothetical protein